MREDSTEKIQQSEPDGCSWRQWAAAVAMVAVSLPAFYVIATTPSEWLLPPVQFQKFTQLERWALLLFLLPTVGFGLMDVAGNVLEVMREERSES